ncbi:sulfatase-like hydrolase/transferase [Streptomyces tubercidicus]|uniref:sulfatase-like hydrolase/transferase n=1 Tax=Streptomyces tubercidicus TaxID=47759 RepID=UPI0036A8B8AC
MTDAYVAATGDSRKPLNVMVIMVDQLRADVLSAYGGQICATPAIDELADSGRVFERAYTSLAVCSPARASLLTGQYPHNHGVLSNEGQLTQGTLKDSPSLLSRQLERLGYDRWYLGKWHLGGGDNLPIDCGLPGHQFPGHGEGGYDNSEYLSYLSSSGLKLSLDGPNPVGWHSYGTLSSGEETDISTFVTDDALAFLNRWSDGDGDDPFFMWVNYWGPHEPYYPAEEWLAQYDGVPIPPWPNYPDDGALRPRVHQLKVPPESRDAGWSFWEPAVRHYFAFLSQIDAQIGRLLAWLEESGAGQDTLVIFVADHGESLGAHGCQDKGHFMYEEIYRIPLIIRCPGLPTGRDDHLVSIVDLHPTVLQLASGEESQPEKVDGRSLLDLLRGGPIHARTPPWRTTLGAEFHGLVTPYTQRMIVDQRHKYVWNMGDLDELYDLDDDPYELSNLINDPASAALCERMRGHLLDWMHETADAAGPYFERHVVNCRRQLVLEQRPALNGDRKTAEPTVN